jgi:hypothetical protein
VPPRDKKGPANLYRFENKKGQKWWHVGLSFYLPLRATLLSCWGATYLASSERMLGGVKIWWTSYAAVSIPSQSIQDQYRIMVELLGHVKTLLPNVLVAGQCCVVALKDHPPGMTQRFVL